MIFFSQSSLYVTQRYQLIGLGIELCQLMYDVKNVITLGLHSFEVPLGLSIVVFEDDCLLAVFIDFESGTGLFS